MSFLRSISIVFLVFLCHSSPVAQDRVRLIDLPNKWNSYLPGSMPLVISAPHGGMNNLESVPDRTCEGSVTVTDMNTAELATAIAERMEAAYGVRPYLVVCNLSRKDVDQNRDVEEATCGNEKMQRSWAEFHGLIDGALKEAVARHGFCLYIDLHGHGHEVQRLELGYLIEERALERLHGGAVLAEDDAFSLRKLVRDTVDIKKLVFGPRSFGTRMAEAGFPSVPSLQDPFPLEGQKFFGGGYNTKRYTGPEYPGVFGWQIESNMKGVRDKSGRPLFAEAFGRVIVELLREHRGWAPSATAR
jgi:hypothetical protein